jgi:2-polyprenyl-3-methyl-5-hydroxy-6-metoxy-1,4-benzoquinol methylase
VQNYKKEVCWQKMIFLNFSLWVNFYFSVLSDKSGEIMECNNCGHETFESFATVQCYFTKEPLSVVTCKNCGLVFLNPRPNKSLGLQYFENAYSNARGFESHSYYRDHDQIFERNKKRLKVIEGIQPPNDRILDFGAGQGHFVKTAIDNNLQAVGVELSPAAIKAAKENFNLDLVDSLEKLGTKDFGIICLWDVIEHLEDPKSSLLKLSEYLHPDGFFVIETSNIDSLDFLVMRNNWSYWHVDHLYYFSGKTIEFLLKSLNFKIVKTPSIGAEPRMPLSKFKKYFPLLNPVKFLAALKRKRIAIKYPGFAKNALMTVVACR